MLHDGRVPSIDSVQIIYCIVCVDVLFVLVFPVQNEYGKEIRKVEAENQQFRPEWTDLYCFTLLNRVGDLTVYIYKVVIEYLEKYKLDMKKLISIITDCALSIKKKNKKKFVQRLINNLKYNNMIISYHFIIHQSVLCCKLNLNLEATMAQLHK